MNHLDPLVAPRFGLTEKAFRKYEPYIAEACDHAELTLHPERLFERHIAARTFILAFKDAILAYRRYHYLSTLLNPDYNFSSLKLLEMRDGSVLIQNTTYALTHSAQPLHLSADDPDKLLISLRSILSHHGRFNDVEVSFDTDAQKQWLLCELPKLLPCSVNINLPLLQNHRLVVRSPNQNA